MIHSQRLTLGEFVFGGGPFEKRIPSGLDGIFAVLGFMI
jgi:hypothetical protein